MLQEPSKKSLKAPGERFAIVASRYNEMYVRSMLRAAREELTRAKAGGVKVIRVPGAFEIPVAVAGLAKGGGGDLAAIICLGVILRGETHHAQSISDAVTHALMRIQIHTQVPVIHEVLLLENKEQAVARCLDRRRNRGLEAARTALEMAQVMKEVWR